jgi:iron complex transport system ATP-binding protein
MIQIEQLTYTGKRGKVILNDINCAFSSGKFTAVLGANGAGKSTLFRCINGEVKFQSGSVYWKNQNLHKLPSAEISKQRAVLRQHYQVSLSFTAREIVEMGRYAYFKTHLTDRCNEVIDTIANLVGITHLMNNSYLSLSGGEQQRVQLARVMAQVWDSPSKERLLLLDEPVSALDILYQHQLMQMMQQLTRKYGFTVIAIVHDLNLTLQYTDETLLLKNGTVVANGVTKEVLTQENIQKVFDVPVSIQTNEQNHSYIQVVPNQLDVIFE